MVSRDELNKYKEGDCVVFTVYFDYRSPRNKDPKPGGLTRTGNTYLAKIARHSNVEFEAELVMINKVSFIRSTEENKLIFYFFDIKEIRKATPDEAKECERIITFNKL